MTVVQPQILIACVGNIFLGDDGFGVEVARQLSLREVPPGVTVKDFGIRSFDLAYALMDPHDHVILVDACARGGEPGSLYVIEPDRIAAGDPVCASVEGHSMNPMSVLRMVHSMGGTPPPLLVVGCEPADLGSDEGKLGLSEPVEAAMGEAIRLIETLISDIRSGVLNRTGATAALHSH